MYDFSDLLISVAKDCIDLGLTGNLSDDTALGSNISLCIRIYGEPEKRVGCKIVRLKIDTLGIMKDLVASGAVTLEKKRDR